MTVLSDGEIVTAMEHEGLVIDPLDDPARQIQPCSVDLRLGPRFAQYSPDNFKLLDPTNLKTLTPDRKWTDTAIVLNPGQFVLGHTIEVIKLPPNLLARVEGRSTFGRLGVTVHITAGFIDPGFAGQITLEIANFNCRSVRLVAGDSICQVCFERLGLQAKRPYGDRRRKSKYQGQMGATGPRGVR